MAEKDKYRDGHWLEKVSAVYRQFFNFLQQNIQPEFLAHNINLFANFA